MKKHGIIERLIMGKKKENDFTEADLPSTRFKQFKFVFRTRFGIIFRANLLAAAFFIFYMVWELLSSGYVSSLVENYSVEEYFSNLIYLSLLQYGTEIPLIMLGFVGLSGLFYVIRRICWGQSVKIVADYGKGIKQSWLQFMLLGLITGIINLLVNYIVRFSLLTMTDGNALGWTLATMLAILFAVIWCVALMFAFCQSSLYKTSFIRLILNSYILTFKRLFRSLFFCVCSLAPILVFAFMPWVIARLIGGCVAIVISFGFAATVQTVYCHGVFDVFINAKSYPDFVGMGLKGAALPEELSAEPVTVAETSEQEEEQTDGGQNESSDIEGGEQ